MAIEKVLFGTYTKRVSKGIYSAELDTSLGELKNAALVAELGNPTYTTMGENNHLYAVDKKTDEGGVAVIDLKTGKIEQEVLSAGASPAYLGFDQARQLVYSGNYHKGTVDVLKVGADGQLTLTDTYQSEGSGPRDEQDQARVHFANLTPDNRLVVVDLGADKVLTFDVTETGKLQLVATFKTEPGFGPRHVRFSPDGQTAYLLGELSSKLSVLHYAAGEFTLQQTVSTIPADWTAHNGAAALRVSPDGKFVYASNRGHNSVAVFDVTGEARLIQWISTEGEFPRDMAFNATSDYLVVGNQETDNVSVYARDSKTGELRLTQKDFAIPESVRIEFI